MENKEELKLNETLREFLNKLAKRVQALENNKNGK